MRVAAKKGVAFVGMGVVCALLLLLMWGRARRQVRAAQQAERAAEERRDRFLRVAAEELQAPLSAGRVEEARQIVAALAHQGVAPKELSAVDLGQLVREIVEAPPFSDLGPPVILRAAPVEVKADRGRLANGLRVLLWTLRRQADPSSPMVITVSAPESGQALVEIEASGTASSVEALERSSAVLQGMVDPTVEAGLTLALRVGSEVARANRGRLSARSRAGHGERYVLELPM